MVLKDGENVGANKLQDATKHNNSVTNGILFNSHRTSKFKRSITGIQNEDLALVNGKRFLTSEHRYLIGTEAGKKIWMHIGT